jgi:hypothetical protein
LSKKTTSSHHKKLSKSNKKKRKDKERKRKAQSEKLQNKKTEKALLEQLSSVEKLLESFPKACVKCKAEFDNKNSQHLDNWVMEYSDFGTILTCDSCLED